MCSTSSLKWAQIKFNVYLICIILQLPLGLHIQICQSLWFYHALWYLMSLKSCSYWWVNLNFSPKQNPRDFVTTEKHIKYSLYIILTSSITHTVTGNPKYYCIPYLFVPQIVPVSFRPCSQEAGAGGPIAGAFRVGSHRQLIPSGHADFGLLASWCLLRQSLFLLGFSFGFLLSSWRVCSWKFWAAMEANSRGVAYHCRSSKLVQMHRSLLQERRLPWLPLQRKRGSPSASFQPLICRTPAGAPAGDKQGDSEGRLTPPLPLSFEPRIRLGSIILVGGVPGILGLSVESAMLSSFVSGGNLLDCCYPHC